MRWSYLVEDMTTRSSHTESNMGRARKAAKALSLRTGHAVAIVAIDTTAGGERHPQGAYYGRNWREGAHHYRSW